MKLPSHIEEKITGSTEHYEKGFIDGWRACEDFRESIIKNEEKIKKLEKENDKFRNELLKGWTTIYWEYNCDKISYEDFLKQQWQRLETWGE